MGLGRAGLSISEPMANTAEEERTIPHIQLTSLISYPQLAVAAAESANPDTPSELTTGSDSGSGSDPSSRRGRLLLLLGKKALIAKAPLLIAKGIGAKKGFAGASIIKSGAVAGASGLAKVSGLAGVTGAGLTGLTGLTGIRGITGGRSGVLRVR